MSFLQTLLFEGGAAFWVFTALLAGVAYTMWLRTERSRRRWIFPAAFATVAGMYALQKIVTTERERLRTSIDETVTAVQDRNLSGVMGKIADGFSADGMDRAEFERYVKAAFQRTEISDTRIGGGVTDIDGDSATTQFTATATVRMELGVQRMGSEWEVKWVREPDGWKIVAIRPESVAGMKVTGLRSLRRW